MTNSENIKYIVYTDGGSRGNPGPAAYGFVVYDAKGRILHEDKQAIGITTNNQAEYQGMVAALRFLCTLGLNKTNRVECYSDSQLMVRQISGQYRIKNGQLKPLLEDILNTISQIGASISFIEVTRDKNWYPDRLVNQALDEAGRG